MSGPQDRQAVFTACRSTQHCAYHGWCRRCAPEFYAVMSDVNRAISAVGAEDSQRGPLYHEVGMVLMPYLLEEDAWWVPRNRSNGRG